MCGLSVAAARPHAILKGPTSGRLRRRRGVAANFIFVMWAGWVTQALVRTIVLHGWLGRFVGVLRSPPARLELPDRKSRPARGRMSYLAGFISAKLWLKTRPMTVRTLRKRPSGALRAVLAATGRRSQHRRPRYRHAIIARLGGRVHRAVRSCDCQDRVSSGARGETHLAGRQGTS